MDNKLYGNRREQADALDAVAQNAERGMSMSLDKAIEHGKEKRKPYRGSKAFDPSCRNHGGCPWCEENRKHKFRDKYSRGEEQMIQWIFADIDTIIDCYSEPQKEE